DSDPGWLGWLMEFEPDTTLPLLVFLLLPLAWMIRTRGASTPAGSRRVLVTWFGANTKPTELTSSGDVLRAFILASLAGAASILVSASLGFTPVGVGTPSSKEIVPLYELPPALHDEYSYLFQARTFLTGRVAFASHP